MQVSHEKWLQILHRRGPDSCQEQHLTTEYGTLDLFGSVLSMRGSLTTQPITDQHGNCLIWNGELFGLRDDASADVSDPGVSDTQLVLDWLSVTCDADHVMRILARIEGPYALIYYHRASQRLYFARDPLGRRSLLLSAGSAQHTEHVADQDEEGEGDLPPPLLDRLSSTALNMVMLSSVKVGDRYLALAFRNNLAALVNCLICSCQWFDVDTRGVYCLTLGHVLHLSLAPWSSTTKSWERDQSAALTRVNPQQELFRLLSDAVRRRVRVTAVSPDSAPVLVLFSGGLDSTVLAALVDLHLPRNCPIDLINVAFPSTPRATTGPSGQLISFDTAPDRRAAVMSLTDLRAASPHREWRLIFADISAEELQQYREHVIQLMYPAHTLMDLSISASLWFAARGQGYIYQAEQSANQAMYRSTARIVLSGLGADECLGGYSRHRTAARRSELDLIRELERDVTRLWYRNCGRDDRLISDHGRELRIPFLDERVMTYLASLPVNDRMNLKEAAGVGDKKLLRQLALSLGLKHSAQLAKRAIQFGSNIARLTKEQNGTSKRAIKGADKIK